MKIGIVSTYCTILTDGHIEYFKGASQLCDYLICILNNNHQCELKEVPQLLDQTQKISILESIKYIDRVILSVDSDKDVCKTLSKIAKEYDKNEDRILFLNGGDVTREDCREHNFCLENSIFPIYNVGGKKTNSSSWILDKYYNWRKENDSKVYRR